MMVDATGIEPVTLAEAERQACIEIIREMAFAIPVVTGCMYADNENASARDALCAAIEAIAARGRDAKS